jgi:hypothetical protein
MGPVPKSGNQPFPKFYDMVPGDVIGDRPSQISYIQRARGLEIASTPGTSSALSSMGPVPKSGIQPFPKFGDTVPGDVIGGRPSQISYIQRPRGLQIASTPGKSRALSSMGPVPKSGNQPFPKLYDTVPQKVRPMPLHFVENDFF